MAQAARVVTVERGVDPRELALVSFGGAGGLHAAGIADELGMSTVIAPVVGDVPSALGLAVSERRRDLVESVLLSGDDLTARAVADVVTRLADRGRDELVRTGGRGPPHLRVAVLGPGVRAAGRGRRRARPGGAAGGLRRGPRGALRLSRPRATGIGDGTALMTPHETAEQLGQALLVLVEGCVEHALEDPRGFRLQVITR